MNNNKFHMIFAYRDDALVLEIYHNFGVISTALDADFENLRFMLQELYTYLWDTPKIF